MRKMYPQFLPSDMDICIRKLRICVLEADLLLITALLAKIISVLRGVGTH